MKTYTQLVRHAGNASLFKAIELSLVSTGRGVPLHLHAEGLRGTGKTTILRSARAILPTIARIKGCPYNCDPARPHCPEHRGLTPEQVTAIGAETVPMPFCEISHSAKVGTVAGSIDLARITDRQNPSAAMLPGSIPRAHRGIVLVDEINRLADTSPELADILLDVMGTKPGRIQIEETGLPTVEMPVVVSVWAASNPDEDPGPLENIRRQLSDRFDLVVNMARPTRATVVREILSPVEAGPADEGDAEASRRRLEEKVGAPAAILPETAKQVIADLYVNFGLESLRAVEALGLAASVAAIVDGRREVTASDITSVAQMVLQHRVDLSTLGQTLEYLEERGTGRETRIASGAVAAAQATAAYAAVAANAPLPPAQSEAGPEAGAAGGGAGNAQAADSQSDTASAATAKAQAAEPERSDWGIQWHKLFAKFRERFLDSAANPGEGRRVPVDAAGRRPDRQAGGGSLARGGRSAVNPGQAELDAGGAVAGDPLTGGGAAKVAGGGPTVASPLPARPLVELPPRDIITCDDPWRKKGL